MKKLIALMLAMVMALSLVACGKPAENDNSANDNNTNTDGDATATRTFVMGVDAEYPPFSYLGEDGQYTGFDVEVCKAVCDLLGWDLQVFGVNWDQKLVQLDAKECDCVWSGMTILDSMKEAGYVISAPYYDNTQVIMVKEGSDIKSSADLAGKVRVNGSGMDLEGIFHNGHHRGNGGDGHHDAHQQQDHIVGLGKKGQNLVPNNPGPACTQGG